MEARQRLGSNTWQKLHDSSSFPDRHISSTWHRCLAQVCSPAGTQSLVCAAQGQRNLSQSPGQQSQPCPGSQMTPQTAASSYLWLVLWGTESCFCMHPFCQLDCAEAFIDTSALSLLLPSPATKTITHSQAKEKVGISGVHTMFAENCLIPTLSLDVCIQPFVFFVFLSSQVSLCLFSSVFCYKTGNVCFPKYELPVNAVEDSVCNCVSYLHHYWSAAIQKLLGSLYP